LALVQSEVSSHKATSTSLLALVQSEVSSHKATSSPSNGIVSFNLFGVWRLSKGIVNFVDMISFLININQ
jgi:hypothetical protein